MNEVRSEQRIGGTVPATSVRRRSRSPWLGAVVLAAFLYVTWCAGLYFCQEWLLFPTDVAPTPLPGIPYKHAEAIRFDIAGAGPVEAWFVPAPGCDPTHPAPVVMFFHGNAELSDYQDFVVEGYRRMGWSVLLPEYRGYGRCGGRPSEAAIGEDMVRFYDVIVARSDVDATRVVFHGRSLGGGVAADLAAERTPAALIVESTFTSAARMAHKYLVPSFLVKHPFRVDRVLATLDAPVLIFHGTRDEVIPVAHGRRLREIAKDATYVEYDCGHNDFPGRTHEKNYWSTIKAFLPPAEAHAPSARPGQRSVPQE